MKYTASFIIGRYYLEHKENSISWI